MRRVGHALAIAALAASAGLGVAACGSSSSDSSTTGGGSSAAGGKTGGSVRIGSTLPDAYDPVMLQTTQANEALQLVYTSLVTYKHATGTAGNDLIPGLAEAMPTVSDGGKTYTFKLRPNLKYSDGTPIKASDFENTQKRLHTLGGPFSSFTNEIVGMAEYVKAKKPDGDITGITSNDQTGEITVKLTKPDTKFLFAIALVSGAPTPAAKSPISKAANDGSMPGAGPYTISIQNPTRQYTLTKNPTFNIPGIPAAKVDKFTVVKETVPKMTQDVINGKLDFMTEDPAGDDLPLVRAKYSNRFRLAANPPNTYWFYMNETTKPFDKLEARQAVNYAIDSRALGRIFGGRLQPTCNFLPPGYAGNGYEKIDPCPYGDPNGPGDIAKAKALVQQSGYAGMQVTVWGNNKDPRPAIVDYLRDLLNQIGFKAKTKILDQQVYFGTVGLAKTKAQIGFTDWFSDFPHPADFFEPNASKASLASSPTSNLQFSSNPAVDAALAKLNPQDPKSVAAEWAKVDKAMIDNADVAVYGNELSTNFFSERMDVDNCNGIGPVYKTDWLQFCLK
ncbi:MAG: peptide/nickel transport system substrate-binding protein [Solirubrobacteraceae bacterium]|nr:peptide/nickel transport system substrate-binding protein [Solirubrobacteraceae bacterium]